jgi:hypothetical protein
MCGHRRSKGQSGKESDELHLVVFSGRLKNCGVYDVVFAYLCICEYLIHVDMCKKKRKKVVATIGTVIETFEGECTEWKRTSLLSREGKKAIVPATESLEVFV